MKFNPVTKRFYSWLFRKFARLEHRLPSGERERIYFMRDLCRGWNQKGVNPETSLYRISGADPTAWQREDLDFGVEEYIKLNSVLLTTIWFSEDTYENELQIEALENIVREYRKDNSVESFLVAGGNIITILQMLVRNYVENPNYGNDLILEAFEEYKSKLGPDEQLAFADEHLNYLAMRGELEDLPRLSEAIIGLPKGEHSDCPACILNRLVRWHLLVKDYQGASQWIDMVISSKLSCDLVPKATKVQQIFVDAMLGNQKRNVKTVEKAALKNLASNGDMVWEACFLLRYAMHTGNKELGETVLDRFEGIIKQISSPEKVHYCLAAYEFSGDVRHREEGLALAQRFDTRNGTSFYGSLFAAF